MRVEFFVPGAPVGKPRQTQRDKWAKRPCVLRYRAWADGARAALLLAGGVPRDPVAVHIEAMFEPPKSLSGTQRYNLAGQPHRVKPDADNVLKAAVDALIQNDQRIATASVSKRWVRTGERPGLCVTIESREPSR